MKPRRALCSALLGIGLLVSGCGDNSKPIREWTPADHGQPRDPDADRMPQERSAEAEQPPEVAILRAAHALFDASCAGCHGRDGRGQGEARPPGAQIPDMTSAAFQSARSDAQLQTSIRDGRGMMPGFSKQLTEQGITALVQYVRTLGPSADAGVAPKVGR